VWSGCWREDRKGEVGVLRGVWKEVDVRCGVGVEKRSGLEVRVGGERNDWSGVRLGEMW